ncbi:MerR family transcriptional regulator [Roseivivax sp. CAU 1761]
MTKSPDAFRTISEVAEWLDTPAHVLRFWESKFTQVKPVKRAGGRRYYRPSDMTLLGGIKQLLHEDGMTIKGVQKLLSERGVKAVAALSPPVDRDQDADIADAPIALEAEEEQREARVVPFAPAPRAGTRTPARAPVAAEMTDPRPGGGRAEAGAEQGEDEAAPAAEDAASAARPDAPAPEAAAPSDADAAGPAPARPEGASAQPDLPDFLARPFSERAEAPDEPAEPAPGPLHYLGHLTRIAPDRAHAMRPLVQRLERLFDGA